MIRPLGLWLICILLYPVISLSNESPYKTELSRSLSETAQKIIQRTPAWIYSKNKTDVNLFFEDSKLKYPEHKDAFSFWQSYILSKMNDYAGACTIFGSIPARSIPDTRTYDLLLLSIIENEPACNLDHNIITLPKSIDTASDKYLLEHFFLYLIQKKQYVDLKQFLQSLDKNILKEQELKPLLSFINAVIDYSEGHKVSSLKIIKTILTRYAGSQIETELFLFLERNKILLNQYLKKEDWLERAKQLISAGYPRIALDIYHSLEKEYKIVLQPQIANAYFKEKDYQNAATQYKELFDKGIKRHEDVSIPTRLVQSYSRSNKFDDAIKMYSSSGSDISLADHNYRIAFLYFDSGQYQRALSLLKNIKSSIVDSDKLVWMKFWCYYFLKDYTQALKILDDRAEKEADINKIIYWRARIYELMGLNKNAKEIYLSISNSKTNGYYSYLAQHRINNKTFIKDSLIDLQNFQKPAKQMPFDPTLSSREALFYFLRSRILGNAFTTYPLHNVSANNLFLNANYNLLAAMGDTQIKIKPPSFSEQAYYWAYPIAYKEWVYFYSAMYDMDPFLALSIMKQESGFRPDVRSPALALGLMQLIPQTSREIAREIGDKAFRFEMLTQPHKNIQFGTYYLQKMKKQFGAHLPYIIAAYNAGPRAVDRWRVLGDKMSMDEFIELIPYEETQNYVKKVLTNYWTYCLLYIR